MAYKENLQSISTTASADLSTKQFYFVNISATGAAVNTTAGGIVDGVLQDKPSALGESCAVGVRGVSKVTAGAAITAGARVMSSATGKAITATATNNISGTALEAATADGDIISVLLDTVGVA